MSPDGPTARRAADAPLRVGLLWHSAASANLGIAALTVANMALARQAAAAVGRAPAFTIYGMRGDGVPFIARGEAKVFTITGRSLISPGGFWHALAGEDCLLDIGGGGDGFAEIYGAKLFAYSWLTKMMALARRVPLLLSPQTIGPFSRWPYRDLARFPLERAAAVFARDDLSLDVVSDLAPAANARLSTDVAFALPYDDWSGQSGESRLRVGVNVSGLMFNDAESSHNRFGVGFHYAELMRRLLAVLAADPAVEVHLVKHVASREADDDNDAPVAEALARAFPGVVVAPDFPGPSQAKSYISGLDFLVGGRMHACIAAFSAGVPVVPIAYSRKVSGLFGMLDYPWVVPEKGMDTDQALAFLRRAFTRRASMKKNVEASMTRVGGLLDVYRTGLNDFFAGIVAAPRR